MDNLLNDIENFEADLSKIDGVKVIKGHDATKVFISLKDLGINGYDLEEILRYKYNIQVELSNYYGVLLICTIGNDKNDFDAFLEAIKSIAKNFNKNHDLKIKQDNLNQKEAKLIHIKYFLQERRFIVIKKKSN